MKVPDRWSLLTFNHPAIDKKISKLLCDKHPGITFDIIAQEPASPPQRCVNPAAPLNVKAWRENPADSFMNTSKSRRTNGKRTASKRSRTPIKNASRSKRVRDLVNRHYLPGLAGGFSPVSVVTASTRKARSRRSPKTTSKTTSGRNSPSGSRVRNFLKTLLSGLKNAFLPSITPRPGLSQLAHGRNERTQKIRDEHSQACTLTLFSLKLTSQETFPLRSCNQPNKHYHLASGARLFKLAIPHHVTGCSTPPATTLAELWTIIRITGDPDDPERSPRIDIEWAREQIAQHGRDNPWVMAFILGQFPPASINALLGIEDVEAAFRRNVTEDMFESSQKRLGIDATARFGDDPWVIFPRQGLMAFKPVEMRNPRSQDVAARVALPKTSGEVRWSSLTGPADTRQARSIP